MDSVTEEEWHGVENRFKMEERTRSIMCSSFKNFDFYSKVYGSKDYIPWTTDSEMEFCRQEVYCWVL